jgi:phosphate transport system permease protein
MMNRYLRSAEEKCVFLIGAGFTLLCALTLFVIIGTIFVNALPSLSWYFVLTPESETPGLGGGAANAIAGTIALSLLATAISTPFAFGTAVYLQRYARDSPVTRGIRFFIEVLSGTPSIILGAFGLLVFVYYMKAYTGGFSLIAGSVALAILILPLIERALEQAIESVPREMEEGSYALGANKWQTIAGVTIPYALSGLITGLVLGFGRAAEESAVVILTAGYTQHMPEIAIKARDSMFMGVKVYPFQDLIGSLPYAVYHAYENSTAIPISDGFAVAFVLICIVLCINVTAKIIVSQRITVSSQKRVGGGLIPRQIRDFFSRKSTREESPAHDETTYWESRIKANKVRQTDVKPYTGPVDPHTQDKNDPLLKPVIPFGFLAGSASPEPGIPQQPDAPPLQPALPEGTEGFRQDQRTMDDVIWSIRPADNPTEMETSKTLAEQPHSPVLTIPAPDASVPQHVASEPEKSPFDNALRSLMTPPVVDVSTKDMVPGPETSVADIAVPAKDATEPQYAASVAMKSPFDKALRSLMTPPVPDAAAEMTGAPATEMASPPADTGPAGDAVPAKENVQREPAAPVQGTAPAKETVKKFLRALFPFAIPTVLLGVIAYLSTIPPLHHALGQASPSLAGIFAAGLSLIIIVAGLAFALVMAKKNGAFRKKTRRAGYAGVIAGVCLVCIVGMVCASAAGGIFSTGTSDAKTTTEDRNARLAALIAAGDMDSSQPAGSEISVQEPAAQVSPVPAAVHGNTTIVTVPRKDALSIGESYWWGDMQHTCRATVYDYKVLPFYFWWWIDYNRFVIQTPPPGESYLVIFLRIENTGTQSAVVPSADAFNVTFRGNSSSRIPYLNTSVISSNQRDVLGLGSSETLHEQYYQWIREIGQKKRDYAYLTGENLFTESNSVSNTNVTTTVTVTTTTSSGNTTATNATGYNGAYLKPGQSQAIDGYLIFPVPSAAAGHLNETYVDVSFNSLSRARWKLGS